jgi:hypothetical protein
MSTITAILDPEPDGSLRLPLPPELRHGKVKVEAKLESVTAVEPRPQFGCLAGKIWLAPDFDAPLDEFSARLRLRKSQLAKPILAAPYGLPKSVNSGD